MSRTTNLEKLAVRDVECTLRFHEQSPAPVSGRTTRDTTLTNRRGNEDPVEYVVLNMSLCVKSLCDILRTK